MKKNKKTRSKLFYTVRKIFIITTMVLISIFAFIVAADYVKQDTYQTTKLIINNSNVTQSIKNEIIIDEKGNIFLSKQDISNFFDAYIAFDEKIENNVKKEIITTTHGFKVASIYLNEKIMYENGVKKELSTTTFKKENVTYIPIKEMTEIYNIEIDYIENTNTLLIDSLDRQLIKADVIKNIQVKIKPKELSRTVEQLKKGNKINYISEKNGWIRIRTENGNIGYIKSNIITNKIYVRQDMDTAQANSESKISMMWDYYSEKEKAPNRNGTKITGINVVSPSFFTLVKLGKGDVVDKIGEEGKEYIKWAKENNLKVWAMVQNDSMIETTSEILKDYNLRQKLIKKIVDYSIKYELDGINIDFENMYKNDKNKFSRFIIELQPRLMEYGKILSVDVTAPDGEDTWSLCYDRLAISENSDYTVFMAYDQFASSSKIAGTASGYDWVEANLNKFTDVKREKVNSKNIILALPLYSRLWKEDKDGNVVGYSIISIKNLAAAIPENSRKIWDNNLKQYYLEYTQDEFKYKMWIEDTESVKEKLSLVNKYNLAGASFWVKDRETQEVLDIIEEVIK